MQRRTRHADAPRHARMTLSFPFVTAGGLSESRMRQRLRAGRDPALFCASQLPCSAHPNYGMLPSGGGLHDDQ